MKLSTPYSNFDRSARGDFITPFEMSDRMQVSRRYDSSIDPDGVLGTAYLRQVDDMNLCKTAILHLYFTYGLSR